MDIRISEQRDHTPALDEAMERLMPQLSARLGAPCRERLVALLACSSTVLFVARTDAGIVGMLTLAWYDAPSGRKAWVEDVVVDRAARGRGIGRALVRAALSRAREEGVRTVSLTSSPSRVEARALYRSEGFKEAETTVFVSKNDRI